MNSWSQHIKATRTATKRPYGMVYTPCRPIKFADGASMSVQASPTHYCTPEEGDPADGWVSFECWCFEGLFEEDEADLYPEGPDADTSDPAGWVSVATLDRIAARHGGVKA